MFLIAITHESFSTISCFQNVYFSTVSFFFKDFQTILKDIIHVTVLNTDFVCTHVVVISRTNN